MCNYVQEGFEFFNCIKIQYVASGVRNSIPCTATIN